MEQLQTTRAKGVRHPLSFSPFYACPILFPKEDRPQIKADLSYTNHTWTKFSATKQEFQAFAHLKASSAILETRHIKRPTGGSVVVCQSIHVKCLDLLLVHLYDTLVFGEGFLVFGEALDFPFICGCAQLGAI